LGLRGELRKSEERKKKERAQREKFHRRLHAKSLAREAGEKYSERKSVTKEKAPLDIDVVRKSHPHFAFFS
jgi:hypothetical protein